MTSTAHATQLPTSPQLVSIKAVEHYLNRHRVKFSLGGSNLALKAQAFFLAQPAFRAEHEISLA